MKPYKLVKWGDYWMLVEIATLKGYVFVEWNDAVSTLHDGCELGHGVDIFYLESAAPPVLAKSSVFYA
jgi:hypothetical protein